MILFDRTQADKGETGVGTRLGRYVLLLPIGVGGMGQVWMAEHAADHSFRRIVAIKLIRGEHVRDAEFRRMFLTEALLASRIAHANVVEVFDLGEQPPVLYQVMEYVEGDSLLQLLARSKASGRSEPPVGVVACVIVDALRGLDAAHEATDEQGQPLGLIHRDVSPHNILVGLDGIARIGDFGIAKALADRAATATQAGQVKGKRGYMSPEQAIGARVDRTSDVYAMGVVAWEAITGKRLHPTGVIANDAPSVSELRPSVDGRLASIVAGALAPEKDRRFATAERMADAIESTGLCATQRDVASWVKELAGAAIEARRNEARSVVRAIASASAPEGTPLADAAAEGRTVTDRAPRTPAPPGTGWALAVLPFRYRGPPADAYLADAFGEELVDVLSRSGELRVFSSGAVARFKGERDPAVVRRDIGADVMVDAILQQAGSEVRVNLRLIDATSGVQLWSEQFAGALEESFDLQETMSRQIAEALRVELSVRSAGGAAPADAVQLCLRARRRLRHYRLLGPDGAKELLEQSVALAPDLGPAVAALAIATVRVWFLPGTASVADSREAEARAAVATALARAPALAETHFSAGLLAIHLGELDETVARLNRALAIAPHYPDALSLLGALECETGRTERGRPRLELAFALAPDIPTAYALAIHHALHGRHADFDEVLSHSELTGDAPSLVLLDMRVGSWHGDTARVERAAQRLRLATHREPASEAYARALQGELSSADADEVLVGFARSQTNARLRTLLFQLGTEVFAQRGEAALAERYLTAAAEGTLFDLDWLEHCPALASLRGQPSFGAARALVDGRIRRLREN